VRVNVTRHGNERADWAISPGTEMEAI
jgi:hypothetical protein